MFDVPGRELETLEFKGLRNNLRLESTLIEAMADKSRYLKTLKIEEMKMCCDEMKE